MITRIFLDLDDVLNFCTMTCLSLVGCKVNYREFSKYNPEWGFDIIKAANMLHSTKKFNCQNFWSGISMDMWANMPISDECNWLIELCRELVGKENVCILTTPVGDISCSAGKVEWIQTMLPFWIRKQFLIGSPKWICASSHSLLIDDKYQNVIEFREHEGSAICVPRPWNILNDENTIKYIKSELIELFHNKVVEIMSS